MYFEDATRDELLQVALFEDCDISYKFEAVRELQLRQWHEDMLPDLVSMWGKGMSEFQIGIELGIPSTTVKAKLIKYNLYRKRVTA